LHVGRAHAACVRRRSRRLSMPPRPRDAAGSLRSRGGDRSGRVFAVAGDGGSRRKVRPMRHGHVPVPYRTWPPDTTAAGTAVRSARARARLGPRSPSRADQRNGRPPPQGAKVAPIEARPGFAATRAQPDTDEGRRSPETTHRCASSSCKLVRHRSVGRGGSPAARVLTHFDEVLLAQGSTRNDAQGDDR
jgi:hypothetical protein